MEPLIGILFIIGVGILWVFFNFPPAHAEPRQVRAFNWSIVALCVMLCTVTGLVIATGLSPRNYEKYGPLLVTVAVLGLEIIIFAVFFVLRNFWIFKPKYPGGSW
jgi:hypothetical protein